MGLCSGPDGRDSSTAVLIWEYIFTEHVFWGSGACSLGTKCQLGRKEERSLYMIYLEEVFPSLYQPYRKETKSKHQKMKILYF